MSETILDDVLAEGDLVVVEKTAELIPENAVVFVNTEGAAVIAVADEAPVSVKPMAPSDEEVQAVLEVIASGAYFRQRCAISDAGVTDTFVVGGPFAPGRQRWVQTKTFDSAQVQAEAIRDALI